MAIFPRGVVRSTSCLVLQWPGGVFEVGGSNGFWFPQTQDGLKNSNGDISAADHLIYSMFGSRMGFTVDGILHHVIFLIILFSSLSLSFPVGGTYHHPNRLHEAHHASWVDRVESTLFLLYSLYMSLKVQILVPGN